jgi:hypothetical protein
MKCCAESDHSTSQSDAPRESTVTEGAVMRMAPRRMAHGTWRMARGQEHLAMATDQKTQSLRSCAHVSLKFSTWQIFVLLIAAFKRSSKYRFLSQHE